MFATSSFRNRAVLCFLFISAAAALPWPSSAQETLKDHQKAVIAFELRFDKLREHPAMKSQRLNALLAQLQQTVPWGLQIENLQRVYGAVSLPESFDDLTHTTVGAPLPQELLIRFEFDNGDASDAMYEAIAQSKFAEEIEYEGNTYIRPKDEMVNLRLHQFNLTTIEVATQAYLMKEKGDVFSEGLTKAWKAIPDHALRIAIDFRDRREFVDRLVTEVKTVSPPMMGGFFDLVNKAANARFSADLDTKNLITFSATGVDEDQAEELRKGLDGLMGLAKMTGQQMLGPLAEENQEDADVVRTMLDALTATRDGLQVNIEVPQPEGFDKLVMRWFDSIRVQAERSAELNRFRQYALAVHNYLETYGKFPIAADDKLSWRVRVLPYLEEMALHDQINIDEPWDSETNKPLADKMPSVFGWDGSTTDVCWIIPDNLPTHFRDITDGTSVTIMMLQVPTGVPWTQAKDLTIDEAIKLFDGLDAGQTLIAVMYDGSARQIDGEIHRTTLRNLLDPKDGNVIDH